MPLPLPLAGFHTLNSALLYLAGEHRTLAVPPEANCFVADFDFTFMQQVLNVSK